MEELTKLIKKYFTIIIALLVIMGALSNKDHLISIFSFWTKILTPFLYGVLLAYILSPIERKLENKKLLKNKNRNKMLSITITYIIFIGIVSILIAICLPQIINSLSDLITQVPYLYNNFIDWANQQNGGFISSLSKNLLGDGSLSIISNNDGLDNLFNKLSEYLTQILPNVLTYITNIFKSSLHWLMAIVFSIYIMYEKGNIKRGIKKASLAYLKEKKTNELIEVYKDCEKILNKFIMAKLLDSFIVGILCAISMAIFKLDYIVLISVIVGITNMIPYIGPFIGGAIGMVLLLSTSPKNAIIFLIIILILQQFDGHILGPKILGGKVGVKPLWILVSLLIGGAFGGVMGMFLGTPIIAMILNLINKDIEKKLQKDGLLDKFKSNDEGLEKEQKD